MIDGNIRGLKELAKRKKRLSNDFAVKTLRTALRAAAKPVVKYAKEEVPVDQGRLRDNIRAKVGVKKKEHGTARIGFNRKAAYGVPVELGTVTQPARPFLRPAIDRGEEDGSILDGFVGALNKTIKKHTGK